MDRRKPLTAEQRAQKEQQEIIRIMLPRGLQTFGIVEQRCGGSRMIVKCLDGKTRNCRIPGRLKRSLWVREGNIVIVEPWEYGGDAKGDIVYKYTPTQINFLKARGHLEKLSELQEF